MCNGYREHCFASCRLGSKPCYGHSISSRSWGSLPWMKTLAVLFWFFFTFSQHYEKDAFSCFSWKHKRSSQGLEAYKGMPVWTILVLMSSELQKIPIKIRIFARRIWKTTICSKVLHLLCAQRSVLLFLCLPGIWGKEVTASSTSLTEGISENPNRGCP